MSEVETLLTIHDVADKLKVSLRTAQALVSSPKFPRPIVFGPRLRRWKASDVAEWIDDQARRAA